MGAVYIEIWMWLVADSYVDLRIGCQLSASPQEEVPGMSAKNKDSVVLPLCVRDVTYGSRRNHAIARLVSAEHREPTERYAPQR